MKRVILLSFLFVGITVLPAFASIPSISYVQQHVAAQIANAVATKADIRALESKVDTAASAKQTMAGTYTVSGTMSFTGIVYAPTAALPPPPTDSGGSDDDELGGSTTGPLEPPPF